MASLAGAGDAVVPRDDSACGDDRDSVGALDMVVGGAVVGGCDGVADAVWAVRLPALSPRACEDY